MQARSRRRWASLILALLIAIPILPITTVSALPDEGEDWALQAQDIFAVFESNGESTTITWRNIDDAGSAEQLWNASYQIYRHEQLLNASLITNMTSISGFIEACDSINNANPNDCRGSRPGGLHSFTFQIPPGVNGSYYYAITTKLGNGTITMELNQSASLTGEPVEEVTTPVRSPYYLRAEFDPNISLTTLTWVNYNIINNVLPDSGPDAYQIHIWQHFERINRSNGLALLAFHEPIMTLPAGTSEIDVNIPPDTNRQIYYSITYVLMNWNGGNTSYEDVRFLSNNSLDTPVKEDNVPPAAVGWVMATFYGEDNLDGEGWTIINWNDVEGEDGEFYRVWMAGTDFDNTTRSDVQLLATVQEGVEQFNYSLPRGRLGNGSYCVSVIDEYGITSSFLKTSSCAARVFEDTFGIWIAEPTNVYAEYLGAGKTLVSWTDQVGVEGESYHIYWSNYQVVVVDPENPVQFKEGENMIHLAQVPDGFGQVIVEVPAGLMRTQSFYFVTSDSRYGHLNGTYEYRGLVQNFYGPITEDTTIPVVPSLTSVTMYGMTDQIVLTWINDEMEDRESYDVWRHPGKPFGEDGLQFNTNVSVDSGWELVIQDVSTDSGTDATIAVAVDIAEGVEREVWYAVTITDEFDNLNDDAWNTPGKNAVLVREDATVPSASLVIKDGDGKVVQNTLQLGSYRLIINVTEDLENKPMVNISSPQRTFTLGDGEEASLLLGTPHDDSIGDTYFFDFGVSNSDQHNLITIVISLTDSVGNVGNISSTDWEIDAQLPSIVFYTPGAPKDTTYMQGDPILISGGVSDDVGVVSIEIRFITASSTSRWMNITSDSTQSEVGWSFAYPVAVADFPYGNIRAEIRAIDAAGNQNTEQIIFKTDNCHHTENGLTRCAVEEAMADPEPTIFESMNLTQGPFLFVFIMVGVNLLALIVVAMTLLVTLSAPRRKKDDEEDEGDDWMKEFIGTSAEPDMDEIAGVKAKDKIVEDEDEEDPFAVNLPVRKERRKKSSDDDDDDDDDDDSGEKKRRTLRRKK